MNAYTCPHCGGEIEYKSTDWRYPDSISETGQCSECEAEFEAVYVLQEVIER